MTVAPLPAAPPVSLSLGAIVLDCPDAPTLACFYCDLLGWRIVDDSEPGWVRIRGDRERPSLSFASESGYSPPVWPAVAGHQQMLMHLDVAVAGTSQADLDAAATRAVSLGATVASDQFLDGVIVCLDPAGHPFCLFLPGS